MNHKFYLSHNLALLVEGLLLLLNFEKFGQNLLDKEKLKNKYKNIDIDSLYEVTSIVPNIIQQLINNFNFVANGLDQIIDNLD